MKKYGFVRLIKYSEIESFYPVFSDKAKLKIKYQVSSILLFICIP